MDEIVAAYLIRKMNDFTNIIQMRKSIAEIYNEQLLPLSPKVIVPPKCDYDRRVYYTYVIQAEDRDEL